MTIHPTGPVGAARPAGAPEIQDGPRGPLGDAAGGPTADRLRGATREFEAVFIQEMLKAMRATVPEGGLLDAGRSEEVFTSLLDEHLATAAAGRSGDGLAEALYRQFTAGERR